MKNLLTKRNVTILNLALLGIFLIALAAVAIPFLKDKPEPLLPERRSRGRPDESPFMSASADTVLANGERLAMIKERNIFCDPRLRPPPPPPNDPVQPLPWVLVGVTKMPDGYVAVIQDKLKRVPGGFAEYIVGEGDEVPGYFGITIVSVTPNPPTVKYERVPIGIQELTMADTTPPPGGSKKDLWEDVIRAVTRDSSYLVKYKELQARNLTVEGVRQTFGLEPVVEGTRVTGLKITVLPRENLLYAAGLRAGDVIETINNKRITSEASAIEQLKAAANGFSIQLGITRARNKRTLVYTLLKR